MYRYLQKFLGGKLRNMSVKVEKLEKNMAKLTIEVPAEQMEKAIEAAYQKNKNSFNIPEYDGQRNILKNIRTLFHATVDQVTVAVYFKQGAASGDFVGRADKLYTHCQASFLEKYGPVVIYLVTLQYNLEWGILQ